jgi:hypothetical protein
MDKEFSEETTNVPQDTVNIKTDEARLIFDTLQDCIEVITAYLVHGDVSKEGWEMLLQNVVDVSRGEWSNIISLYLHSHPDNRR